MLYPVELGVRGLVIDRFAPHCGGPIIMPENGRENKAGSVADVTFGLIFDLD